MVSAERRLARAPSYWYFAGIGDIWIKAFFHLCLSFRPLCFCFWFPCSVTVKFKLAFYWWSTVNRNSWRYLLYVKPYNEVHEFWILCSELLLEFGFIKWIFIVQRDGSQLFILFLSWYCVFSTFFLGRGWGGNVFVSEFLFLCLCTLFLLKIIFLFFRLGIS